MGMKKVFFYILLLVTFFCSNEVIAQTPQWSNWSKFASCFLGFEFRVKAIGFNKYVSKYEWIAQVKNSYGRLVHFNMSWTVGSEKQVIGRFSVQPGNTSNAVSYYFNSNAEALYVGVSEVCFGENWLSCTNCYAACDGQPGVPNQPICNTNNSTTNSSTTNNNTSAKNNYSDRGSEQKTGSKAVSPPRDPKYLNAKECALYFPNGSHPDGPGDCIWESCPCPHKVYGENVNFSQNQTVPISNTSPQLTLQNTLNQYNEALIQNTISNIQNTPINTFEVGKLEIKNVKRQPASGTGVDKGSVSSISGLDKIEIEFEEFSNKKETEIFDHVKPVGSTQRVIELLRGVINSKHSAKAGKIDFDLTINEKGFVVGVSLLSEPRDKELEDKVSSDIRFGDPMIFYHTPATTKSGKPVSENISYSVTYSSSDDVQQAINLKAKNTEAAKNPRTVPLDNGQEYELKGYEELIETKNVTPLSSFSKEVILAKINELKNLPGDAYKKIKGFFDLEFLNNADLTNEKNNIKDTPTPSYSSDRLTMVNGVLFSVRRVNNKMSILTPIEK
jgi:hypothetical protein